MRECSCSIPLVVRLRGVPDDVHLADMSETIARTVADRLAEAAGVIAGRKGWASYRQNHAPPALRFSGGSLDATSQRRVAAAIEAGIARAIASASGAGAGPALLPRFELPQSAAPPAAAPPRLVPQETEAGWTLNGISVFRVQRPDSEAESRLDFQPLLSTNSDGSTKLLITVVRDPDVIVLLKPDAVSQLTALASEIDIRDVVTAAAQERPRASGAPPTTETALPTAIPERARVPPSPGTPQELQQAIDVPAPTSSAAIAHPQVVASRLLSPPRYGPENGAGAPPQLILNKAIATEREVFKDQPGWSSPPGLASGSDPDTAPQSPDAPSRSERHDLPYAADYDSLRQLTGVSENVGTHFKKNAADGSFGEEQQQRIERVIVLQSRVLLTEEEFDAGVERARGPGGMILPYKKAEKEGSEASILAFRLPGNRVSVRLRGDIFATAYAADQDLRLPPAIGKGVELDETDVVGVKFIDEGILSFFPALLLLYLENDATRAALAKAGEAVVGSLALGAGSEAAADGVDAVITDHQLDTASGTGRTSADHIALGLDLSRDGSENIEKGSSRPRPRGAPTS